MHDIPVDLSLRQMSSRYISALRCCVQHAHDQKLLVNASSSQRNLSRIFPLRPPPCFVNCNERVCLFCGYFIYNIVRSSDSTSSIIISSIPNVSTVVTVLAWKQVQMYPQKEDKLFIAHVHF